MILFQLVTQTLTQINTFTRQSSSRIRLPISNASTNRASPWRPPL